MRISELIERLDKLKLKHGNVRVYAVYGGSVQHIEYVTYDEIVSKREVYVESYWPKNGIYQGIFLYPD